MTDYKQPNEIFLPVGLDKKIKEINEALDVVDWLTVKHGRVWRVNESAEKKSKVKFKLLTDGDFLTIAKDDNVNAFSFFVAESPENVIDSGQDAYEREIVVEAIRER